MAAIGHATDLAAGLAGRARNVHGILGADGTEVGVRVTDALGGPPKGVLFHVNGTAADARFTDAMGARLARDGITTVALGSRSAPLADGTFRAMSPDLHVADLDAVIEHFRSVTPGTPAAIAGTSLGASIVMLHNARGLNTGAHEVLALAPVALEKFLPVPDKARVIGSLFLPRVGDALAPTPMAVGRRMSTEAASPYNTEDLSAVKVPAHVFADVARMNLEIALRGRQGTGHTTIVIPDSDAVAVGPASRLFAKLVGGPAGRETVRLPGAPHELSQEVGNDRLVQLLRDSALGGAPL
jgi:alpha-beta hydrolase superfamily lysophospholipase